MHCYETIKSFPHWFFKRKEVCQSFLNFLSRVSSSGRPCSPLQDWSDWGRCGQLWVSGGLAPHVPWAAEALVPGQGSREGYLLASPGSPISVSNDCRPRLRFILSHF